MTNATSKDLCSAAIEILSATHDGDDLSARDLRLVESAVNDRLNEHGRSLLRRLLETARVGYDPAWYEEAAS